MELSRPRTRVCWRDERGFTLPEVLITILLLGIVLGIATASWFGVVRSREVDSATNQLVADLRKAHSTATNRLVSQKVTLTDGSSKYSVTGVLDPDLDDDPADDTVTVDVTAAITFCSNGRASAATSDCTDSDELPITFRVNSADGNSFHDIEVIPATSRVQVDP